VLFVQAAYIIMELIGVDEDLLRNRFFLELVLKCMGISLVNATPLVVVLDPEVTEVFTTPEAGNKALRALITAMPEDIKRKVPA
jgi:hypothetical protein